MTVSIPPPGPNEWTDRDPETPGVVTGIGYSARESSHPSPSSSPASTAESSPTTHHQSVLTTPDQTNPKDLVGVTKLPVLSVVPASSILYEAHAMENGAAKYGAFNWRKKKVRASIYADACSRHLMAWYDGEDVAPDSLVHHLAHAKACLGILIDAIETGNLKDDRPVAGSTAKILERLRK